MNTVAIRANRRKLLILAFLVLLCAAGYMLVEVNFSNPKLLAYAMMLERDFNPGFKIDLHIKDLNNALDCAHSVGAPVPMTAGVQEILQWVHNHEGGQKDHSAIAQYYECLTNMKIGR